MTDTIIGEESEMLHLQGIFAKAANAIVEASQLRKEVANLQVQMKQLSESVDALRISNEQLVSELHALRQEKAEIQGKLWQSEAEVGNLKIQVEQKGVENEAQRKVIEGLEGDLRAVREENAGLLRSLKAESEEATRLREKLSNIQEAFEPLVNEAKKASDSLLEALNVFGRVTMPKVETVQEPSSLPEWKAEEVKAFQEAPVPFVQSPGQSLGNGEQPRAEDGKFEPVPMAARHFE